MSTNKEISVTKGSSESVPRPEMLEDQYVLPLADIFETPDAYVVMLDMPGADRETMRVRLENGSLAVTAPVARQVQEKGTVLHEEARTFGYMRTFTLGEGIDLANIDAQFQDGVLSMKLFKNEEMKPREISIS